MTIEGYFESKEDRFVMTKDITRVISGCWEVFGLVWERGQVYPESGPVADVGHPQLADCVLFLRELGALRRLRGLDILTLLIPP